jgi:hypothetical protein
MVENQGGCVSELMRLVAADNVGAGDHTGPRADQVIGPYRVRGKDGGVWVDRKLEVERRLGELDGLRQKVEQMDAAMQVLTPEERLVVQMLLVCPEKGAAEKLCQILQVERASVYRRRERAIRKLAKALFN